MSYWLISVPNESKDNSSGSFDSLNRQSSAVGLSRNFPFAIPPLKVGTLDSLMALSDELAKFEPQVGQIAKKIEKTYYDYLKAENEQTGPSQPQAGASQAGGDLKVKNLSSREFVEKFQWDRVRYPERSPLKTITELIVKEANKSDEALRKQVQDYNEVRAAFTAIERKDTGSLLVKPLAPFVKESDLVERGHLTTILLVVPRAREQEFLDAYETMEAEGRKKEAAEKERREREKQDREQKEKALKVSDDEAAAPVEAAEVEEPVKKRPLPCAIVVPRSAKKLLDDAAEEYLLYRVVLLREGSEYFKNLCRERRFTVRPFALNAQEEKEEKEKKQEFLKKKKALWTSLLRWCSVSYSEVFSAWAHLKAIRLYVESVLRYGLPVNFSAFLIEPTKGKDKQLRAQLKNLYEKLAGSNAGLTKTLEANEVDLSGFGADFYPYVYLPLIINE